MKQFWSSFKSHFKHVSRTNMLCYLVSKFMCQSQYKAILEHVWITFQARFKNKYVVLTIINFKKKCFLNAIFMLQRCFNSSPDMLQFCSRCASQMVQLCYRSASFMLKLYSRGSSLMEY
jgi:hypothetical protein